MATYFCDGLRNVAILNGVARLEFHRLEPVPGDQGSEARSISELIVALPLPGVVQALAVLEQLREKLVQDGVLKPVAELGKGVMPESVRGTSPNFS